MDKPDEGFASKFKELTGHDPYPWQRRLYERLVSGGIFDALDIPTGLGKTSIISIWLLAHLHAPPERRPPMRLVYVVNRRTIVDQATEVARQLQEKVGKDRLAISTLRGALADAGEWLLTPHRPAVIIGTVDMIGSRLLFNPYRAGRWQRSRHAGLLGQDTLIVHDEAHLSGPFQELLDWIRLRQKKDGSPRSVNILPMSATHDGQGDNILRISSEDRKIAKNKLGAAKRVHLHGPEADLAAQLARLASTHEEDGERIIIFVRLPETARKVREKLLAKPHKIDEARIELLTGTIRGHERDELVEKPVLRHLLHGWGNDQRKSEYLAATSAGEVGADFDADHIVCDLSTLDAMIQRFGRVNRRGGEGREARIDVVLDRPAAKTRKDGAAGQLNPLQQARLACARFLEDLQNEQGDGFDASPEAIAGNPESGVVGWRDRSGYDEACEPHVPTVTPHDVTLDAWSLTSIQEDWPLAHEVAPYLHGLDDEDPQTFVAWRAELDELGISDDENVARAAAEKVLAHYPLRPAEMLHDRPGRVAELLIGLRKWYPEKPIVLQAGRRVEVRLLRDLPADEKQLSRELRFRTIILPTQAGGLTKAGMIDPTEEAPAPDVADQGEREKDRNRVLLMRDEEGEWWAKILPEQQRIEEAEPSPSYEDWAEARDALVRQLQMRYFARIVLSKDEEGRPSRVLLLFREALPKKRNGDELRLETHHRDVESKIEERIKDLRFAFGPVEAEALRFAGKYHDLGKGWDAGEGTWQQAIYNKDQSTALAKSRGRGMDQRVLAGYRHEFGSLAKVVAFPEFAQLDEPTRDLALHLIATHHGRGRPGFSTAAMKTPVEGLPDFLQPAEIARRFDRLQRRYGHWGLAWLESILISADAEASQEQSAPAAEDEEVEDQQQ